MGKCHQCHDSKGDRPLFTDFQYHNLGVPRNPDHPVYSYDDIPSFDPGLGGFTDEAGIWDGSRRRRSGTLGQGRTAPTCTTAAS